MWRLHKWYMKASAESANWIMVMEMGSYW
jgi:hypothetical protein